MAPKEPKISVDPGEPFIVEIENSMSGRIKTDNDLPTPEVLGELHRLKQYNPCAGPIGINGAEPGDVIAVEIIDIVVGDRGYVLLEPGIGPLADSTKHPGARGPFTKFILHKPGPSGTTSDGTGVFDEYTVWNLQPMIGTMGVVPDRPSSGSDTVTMQCMYGGNLDTREFRKGHRVFFPVAHNHGLLYVGDVHATQATEFGGTGDESRAEVTLRCEVVKKKQIPFVRVETPNRIIQLNSYRPIDEGIKQANLWLLDWLVEEHGFTARDATLHLAVNPEIRANIYALSMWGRMNYTVGVSIPRKFLRGR
jgi:acetamidase/formamidase